jgi:GMP synthase (glutamine-hydrolysing)
MTTALVLQHHQDEGLGLLAEQLAVRQLDYLIVRPDQAEEVAEADVYIVMGGPQSANDGGYVEKEIQAIGRHVEAGKPYLGICLGAQLLAKATGGSVMKGTPELGNYVITLTDNGQKHGSRAGIENTLNVFQMHDDTLLVPYERVLATGNGMQQAVFHKNALGLQFHIEATQDMVEAWVSSMDAGSAQRALEGFRAHQEEYRTTLNSLANYFFARVGL